MAKYKIIKTSGPVTFPLSTVFVDKYMPGANPLYVQVYLYGLRLCYGAGMESDNKKIAEALDMLETDVYRAFKYWEKKGIVKLSGDGVEFVDLSSEAVEEKSEKPTYKPDEISDIIDHNNEIKQLILHAECIFGKTLSQSDTATLLSFYDWLRLPLEVILMLLEHCASLSKTSMRYAEKVAISWADEGIDTIDKAKEFLVNSEKRSKINRKYKRLFGIVNRDLSDTEYAHIIQWTESMEMSQQLIKAAYEKTILVTGGVSFPYMNGILQSWYKKGITKIEETQEEKPVPRETKPSYQTKREKRIAETDWHDYDIDSLEKAALKKSLEN